MQYLKDFLLSIIVIFVTFLLPWWFFKAVGTKEEFAILGALIIYGCIQAILMNGGEE